MIDTDKYEQFENAMNEGRIERVHCLWALAEVKRWKKEHDTVRGWFLDIDNYMMEHHYDMWQEIRIEIGLDEGEEE